MDATHSSADHPYRSYFTTEEYHHPELTNFTSYTPSFSPSLGISSPTLDRDAYSPAGSTLVGDPSPHLVSVIDDDSVLITNPLLTDSSLDQDAQYPFASDSAVPGPSNHATYTSLLSLIDSQTLGLQNLDDDIVRETREANVPNRKRSPGACTLCKNVKMRCVFATPDAECCKRCLACQVECVVPGRRARPRTKRPQNMNANDTHESEEGDELVRDWDGKTQPRPSGDCTRCTDRYMRCDFLLNRSSCLQCARAGVECKLPERKRRVRRLRSVQDGPSMVTSLSIPVRIESGTLKWDHVKNITGSPAASFMDQLHAIVEDQNASDLVRTTCRNWILRLHRRAGVIPTKLFIMNVSKSEEYPVTGGAFGDIYMGTWLGKSVALKVSRFFTTASQAEILKIRKDFHREAVFWMHLKHPHILPFIGISDTLFPERLCMVCPWMSNGNLLVYIKNKPGCDRRELMRQTASGLAYLHSFDPPLVHGDVKCANILVDEHNHACLCDFGLVSFAEKQSVASTQGSGVSGSLRWKAPELIRPVDEAEMRKTRASDIYALGMTILEAYTDAPPFQNIREDVQVMFQVVDKRRPSRPSTQTPLTDDTWGIITSCWEHESYLRPTAMDVVRQLRDSSTYFGNSSYMTSQMDNEALQPTDGLLTNDSVRGISLPDDNNMENFWETSLLPGFTWSDTMPVTNENVMEDNTNYEVALHNYD